MPLFDDLRAQLLSYKHANASARQNTLDQLALFIENIPTQTIPKDIEEANSICTKFAYAATLINYADALHRIETQQYFDILVDFKMSALLKETDTYAKLNQYIEFHPTAPQMKLLKPVEEIPKEIWQLFRDAQKETLARAGKTGMFHLDELPITNDLPDQLYPLPIQMFGRATNFAVDRLAMRADGAFRFAQRFGMFLLPGGGMVEVDADLTQSERTLLCKMLDEHLEEEHANLWHKAANDYNQINLASFLTVLDHTIKHKKMTVNNQDVIPLLDALLLEQAPPASILAEAIRHIDQKSEQLKSINPHADIRDLNELRAAIQVETFKLTPIYDEAYHFLKTNTQMVDIEQFGDTRACGGQQISHCFLTIGSEKSLEGWFEGKVPGGVMMGDDLSGSTIVEMSLAKALENYSKVKFSHLLIALELQTRSLNCGIADLSVIWKPKDYDAARLSLVQGAQNLSSKISLDSEQTNNGKTDGDIDDTPRPSMSGL
jgi:hypothetical protein